MFPTSHRPLISWIMGLSGKWGPEGVDLDLDRVCQVKVNTLRSPFCIRRTVNVIVVLSALSCQLPRPDWLQRG